MKNLGYKPIYEEEDYFELMYETPENISMKISTNRRTL